MTKIRICWEEPELTASGHAGGAPQGQNIICAGISAITMALLNAIRMEMDEGPAFSWEIREDTGYLKIKVAPNEMMRPKIMNYFEMAYIGLKAIEQENPEEISIEEV